MEDRKKYSTTEIAERFNVTPQTIREWARLFDIPHRNHRGMRFTDEAMQVFQSISMMRGINSDDTIRRNIRPLLKEPPQDESKAKQAHCKMAPNLEQDQPQLMTRLEQKIDNLAPSLQQQESKLLTILKENNELAEKYARATYTIGQQEERIKQLEERVKILPAPEQWILHQHKNTELQERIDSLQIELADERRMREQLQAQLTQHNRSLWQRIQALWHR